MTAKAFVIGHPVAHSRSPLIHGYWCARYDVDGAYERIEIAPFELTDFLQTVRQGAFVGGNVTVPHKQAAMALCEKTDDAAQTIGAVNTLVLNGGQLFGINTDWYGFLANLDDRAPGWDGKPGPATVIGAGGSARAIAFALSRRGFSPIGIVNRTPQRAEALTAALTPVLEAELEAYPLDKFGDIAPETRVLVNTSTVGMHGTRFDNLALERLPGDAVVADIVYTPLVTPLLADAAALGLQTVDGLGMLLHQAVPGFEAWFGIRPEATPELRILIEKDMGLS